jgi:hypothetical protein
MSYYWNLEFTIEILKSLALRVLASILIVA